MFKSFAITAFKFVFDTNKYGDNIANNTLPRSCEMIVGDDCHRLLINEEIFIVLMILIVFMIE